MKKLTSKEKITFRVNGETVLEINSKGCVCSEEDAAVAVSRLGALITAEDVKLKDVAEEAISDVTDEDAEDVSDDKPRSGRKPKSDK